MNATAIETWIVTDSAGEFVRYYNPTGHVMVFTREREEAMATMDSRDAYEIARIARETYGRKQMRMAMK